MAPNKRKAESLESLLARTWCYYCERTFPGFKDLCDHQRSKHFKCIFDADCKRKLQTAGGLKVHMLQVHKAELKEVPNADPGRKALDPEIFAMDGIPQHLIQKHNDAIIKQWHLEEAEWMKRTGNSLHGNNEPAKKPKLDVVACTDDTKLRARAFREKKMAQRKLRDEAIARGEEPPKFAPIIPSAAAPAATLAAPTPVTTTAAEPSVSPPAAAAAPYMPTGDGLPHASNQSAYPTYPSHASAHNQYSPQAPYNAHAVAHTGYTPLQLAMQQAYPVSRPLPALPPGFPSALPHHLPAKPSGLPQMSGHAPSQFPPATAEEINTMIDDNKRIVDAQKQANEMSHKTVTQLKLNTDSSSDPPVPAASTNSGMLMKNSSMCWEEKRGQNPRYNVGLKAKQHASD